MKYLILFFALLSSLSFAQDICVTSGEYKLKYRNTVQQDIYKSQDSAVKAAKAAKLSCACRVGVIQPVLTVDDCPIKSSSSKSSSKASISSVSSVQSSAQSSVASSSESSAKQITATWKCALIREDGTAMTESEIGGYYLVVGNTEPINLAHTGCDMAHIIPSPAQGVQVTVAEYDTSGTVSRFAILK